MKTLMFYSYKGGSGRTVAAANVAAALAKLGHRVAIVDLDVEAPGLQHVLGAERMAQYKRGDGIQQYLKGDIDLDELITEVAIDTFAQDGPLFRFDVPGTALLLYIMASPKVTRIDAQEPLVADRMKKLLEALRDKRQIDFVVLDSASGVRETYSISADASDEMLVFFRWSIQHVEGTLRFARFMSRLKEFDQHWIPFKLVACASPSERELDGFPDDALRERLLEVKNDTRLKILQTLKQCQASPATIFHEIPELLELKWRETIIVFGDTISPYEELAKKLLQPVV